MPDATFRQLQMEAYAAREALPRQHTASRK